MSDFEKLDSFFDAKNLKQKPVKASATAKRAGRIRLVKIALPAVAASLIGLLVIIPSLKDRALEFKINITRPSLSELEKLHMENTVFYITDKDNMVNEFTAAGIDEMTPGSHLIKLADPHGYMPSLGGKWMTLRSPAGLYDQNTKILTLNNNVLLTDNNGTITTTAEMFFDANDSKAYGVLPVTTKGNFGSIDSQGFEYYKNTGILTLLGKTNLDSEQNHITADKKVDVYQQDNKVIAYGNIHISSPQGRGWGDILEYYAADKIAILKGKPAKIEGDEATITAGDTITYLMSQNKATAIGDVIADNGQNRIYADRMDAYFDKNKNIERVEIPQNPKIITADGEVKAKSGIYYPSTGMVMLFENVEILHKGNIMKGDRAETNLNTSISKVLSGRGNRVEGYLLEEATK